MNETLPNSNKAENNSGWDTTKDVPFRNTESSDFIWNSEYGVDLRNLEKIDISTNKGQYEWLDAKLENKITICEEKIDRAKDDGYTSGDDILDDLAAELKFTEQQQNILANNIDIDDEGGTIGALQREYLAAEKSLQFMKANGSEEAIAGTHQYFSAVSGMLSMLEAEIEKREP